MNRRSELVRRFALDAIADDYEDLETITRDVSRAGAQCGLAIQPTEIVQELLRLIELGWADVYYLSQWQRDANKIAESRRPINYKITTTTSVRRVA